MFDWLSPWIFLQTMARIIVVWLAFYGTGKMLRKPMRIDTILPLLPSEIVGLLAFVLFTIPLSVLGIMNRMVCPVLMVILAVPGALFSYGRARDCAHIMKPKVSNTILGVFLLFLLVLNFTHASMPNLAFDDPLITYAVQPDRWLNTGRVFWLEETTFSGFPLFYEMTAVWPASLSADRMDQISLLQVFQMSLLVVSIVRGLSIIRVKKSLWLPVCIIVLLTTSLYYWCSFAKTDTLAILFCTLALSSAVRQSEEKYTGSQLSSWFLMGCALATKQTSLLILVPFLLYSTKRFLRQSFKSKVLSLSLLALLPCVFAVRTMLKTGSPSYPVYPISSMVREGWELEEPHDNTMVNTRSSYLYEQKNFPLAKHIGIFFAYMEGNILLLLAGLVAAIVQKRSRDAAITLPVFVYSIAAIAAFWPPWWGAKYSILIYPFVALIGASLLSSAKAGKCVSVAMIIPAFVIPGFIAVAGDPRPFDYRFQVTESVLSGQWRSGTNYRMLMSTPEGMTQMWANEALPRGSVLFSIHEEKRYFFDGTVIVGWRHPLGQLVYRDNSLEDELAVLDSLHVDYIGFYRENPAVLEQERLLAILDHIGVGEILEPVIIVDGGYMLCRYNPSRR